MGTTLVTGATGRVGSRFVPRLLAAGEPARVLVRDAAAAAPLARRGAELVEGDLRDAAAVRRALDGVTRVAHLAAAFRGVEPAEGRAVNHDATVTLAEAALEAGVERFVHVSTTLVYGPGRGRPASEDDRPQPPAAAAYPQAKAAAEDALRALWRERSLGLRILRLAFVYGDGDPHLEESLTWASRWPAHQRLQLVHHADVAQALLRALRAPGLDGETFNVADDAPVTALELHRLNGVPVPDGAAERPLQDPWEGIADTSAARTKLGFRPVYPSVYSAQDAGAL